MPCSPSAAPSSILAAHRRLGPGLVVGVAGTAAVARLIERLLYRVHPSDPLILAVAIGAPTTSDWRACCRRAAHHG
jgi:hypothetical protein